VPVADALNLDSGKKQPAVIPTGKPVISSEATTVANDLVNEQEFQQAIKNLDTQKPEDDGKIKLADLPADMKAEVASKDTDDLMTKVAATLNDNAANTTKKSTDANATKTADAGSNGTQTAEVKVASATDASTNGTQDNDLLNKFETADNVKPVAKVDAKHDNKFTIDTANITAQAHAQDVQNHIKEIKVDPKAAFSSLPSPSEQVEIKIAQMIKDGVDMIRIKLHPADLGGVDIQMDVQDDGKTAIRIIADKTETLDMLRRDSHSLERALKDTGVKTDAGALQFSLREQNQQNNFANFNNGKHQNFGRAEVNDNYLKAANVNQYTLTLNPDNGVNILA
jgi:hypothetical protein